MLVRQRAILIAAGAGGGIAATFNTPIGGMAFAAELMLPCINPLSLLCVGIAKLLPTCITLGSGASGGVFSPCMFIGASVGAGCSSALAGLLPGLALNPVHFAVAGMAAMVGGTTGAAITATIMTFEMTRDYTVILPMILTVTLASAVRHWLLPATIYTLKLQRRGHVVPQGLQAWDGERESRHIMSPEFRVFSESESRNEALIGSALTRGQVLVVMGPENNVREVMGPWFGSDALVPSKEAFVTVRLGERIGEVQRDLHRSGARVALVIEGSAKRPQVRGVITERELAKMACATAQLTG
jgi:CIC family chloride channel protein